jgi:GTP pyrophosphokinase
MKMLPKGATVLDCAYDIHSELGNHCIGAKVNHILVPMSHVLKSGDQVEIITSSKQKPSEEWLDFLITAKAKSKVKSYFKEKKRKTTEEGKQMLQAALETLHANMSHYNLNEMCAHYKKASPADLYYSIATGTVDLTELNTFSIHGGKLFHPGREQKTEGLNLVNENEVQKTLPAKGEPVILGGSSGKIIYKLANCCQPIPGDNVFGYLTSNEDLIIHRTDCPNAARLLANYGHKIIKTRWAKNKEISFLSGIRITGLDDVGVIQKITNVISGDLKMNMRSLSIDSKDGIFEGQIMVYVHDREELEKLVNGIAALDGIHKIERLEYTK